MTTAKASGGEQPTDGGRDASRLAQVFALEPQGFNLPRALVLLAVFLAPLIVLGVIDKEQYILSTTFGALFVGLMDRGGAHGYRVTGMAAFPLMGAAVTALGFRIRSTVRPA
jgi:hypothetical protein